MTDTPTVRLIIAGSRNFEDFAILSKWVDNLCSQQSIEATEVISGCCRGTDRLGERWANERNIPIRRFPAQWDKYGPAAGPIRNRQMAEGATHLIAFLDNQSRGTRSMIKEARKQHLEIAIVSIDTE